MARVGEGEAVNATEVTGLFADTWILSNARPISPIGPLRFEVRTKRLQWNQVNPTFWHLRKLTKPSSRIPPAEINPGRPELCGDGVDNNCNGLVDEGCSGGCRGCQID